MPRRIIIDSHLDLAWNAITWKRDLQLPLAEMNEIDAQSEDKRLGRGNATITLPELRKGAIGVCLGTMMGRVPYGERQVHGDLDFPTHECVYAFASGQLGYYHALAAIGDVRLIETATQLNDHIDLWRNASDEEASILPIGIIVAMEGSDAIMTPDQVEHWFGRGLRCTSLVHYGRSKYAVGTGEDGPLTEDGREILKEIERVGMILDVTHLSDPSFFEAMELYHGPVLASHQNCRALVPGQRQFSDEHLSIIIERKGVIGLAMDAWMLSPGWVRGETDRSVVHLSAVVDHARHICDLAGNCDHVAIGSDLDGGFGTEQTPTGLDSIADLQTLPAMFAAKGFSEDDIDKIFFGNWQRFFTEHLPS
ncbi:MAG: dipeptidase [Planctomycetales bacterium]|nr:dipeptidase [Planctomycetales bacterium]